MRGEEIGKKVGKEIGEHTKLIDIVCKKLRKGKSVAVIADELEEEIEVIEQICNMASAYATEYHILH